MTAGFIMADLLATLRNLEPVLRRARATVSAGGIADSLEVLEDARADAVVSIKVASTPRIGTCLGDLLRERSRFEKDGAR